MGRATRNRTAAHGSGGTFQSTPSVGRATSEYSICNDIQYNFNPRPPWGGRRKVIKIIMGAFRFQSTPSVGRATARPYKPTRLPRLFQSTPSVGRATFSACFSRVKGGISIHALRGEGDAPCIHLCVVPHRFQSTPSVGRATIPCILNTPFK